MKKSNSLVIGLIVMLATAAVFLLATQNILKYPMCWLCLSSLLILEIVTTALFHVSGGDPRKVGAAIVFAIETVVMILLSVLFINVFLFSYTWYLAIFVLLTALAAVPAFILLQSGDVSEADAVRQQNRENIRQWGIMVQRMINSAQGEPYAQQLKALYEEVEFANRAVTSVLDGEIHGALCQLSENLGDSFRDVPGEIKQIINLLKRRRTEHN